MNRISVIITVVLALILGIISGRYYEQLQGQRLQDDWSKQRAELQTRTEGYIPTCDDLRKGLSIVRSGDDTFVVEVTGDRFVVFGLNGKLKPAPATAWWGAGIDNGRENCQ